jgi:hypothetical protein
MLKINGANLRKVEVPIVDLETQISILSSVSKFTAMLREAEKRFDAARRLQAWLANDAVRKRAGGS